MHPTLAVLKEPGFKVALIGATNDSTKFGNKIYKNLKSKGIVVWGVNPKATTIDGDPAYHDLRSLPEKPSILNFVVPPKLGIEVARLGIELGFDHFWMQPGAESPEIKALVESSGKHYLEQYCIMVET